MEETDPKRVIVTESCCHACNINSFLVHHQTFPEIRIEAMSADRAAMQLANRLQAALHMVADAARRETVRLAIDDLRAFVDQEGALQGTCNVHKHTIHS